MSESHGSHSKRADMDKTPDKSSFKIGPDRVALLTGTYKRPKPYPDSADRRRADRSTDASGSEFSESLASLPATRAVLAAMRSLPSPSTSSEMNNSSLSMTGVDFKSSIKRAAIDWKLANKEAEVFKLKTDIQKLESLLRSRSEGEEKLKIEYDKKLAKEELHRQAQTSKIRALEQEVEKLRSEISALKDGETEMQTAFLPEKESLEKTIIQLKVNDCDLRAKILNAEEEVKSAKLLHDHERLKMSHEIKCLNLELDSAKMDKKLLEESSRNLKKELQEMVRVKAEVSSLQSENDSLKSSLKSYEESAELRRLFQDDMNELKKLRDENADLKLSLAASIDEDVLPDEVAEVPNSEEDSDEHENLMSGEDEGSSSMRSDPQEQFLVHEIDVDDVGDDDDEDESCFVEVDAEASDAADYLDEDDNNDSDIAEVSSD